MNIRGVFAFAAGFNLVLGLFANPANLLIALAFGILAAFWSDPPSQRKP